MILAETDKNFSHLQRTRERKLYHDFEEFGSDFGDERKLGFEPELKEQLDLTRDLDRRGWLSFRCASSQVLETRIRSSPK